MKLRRFDHDLSHVHTLSANMGLLIPIAAVDVLPGDSFIHATNLLARVAPLQKPVMHPVEIRVHNWFVPNRILWDDWEDFAVGNEGGATYPTLTPASAAETPIYDHMGVEPVTGVAFDALPIRAYNTIWNEYYRDQDLSTARGVDDLDLARIAWGKDYFTTARAVPQQGTAVEVGFSQGTAPITGLGFQSGAAMSIASRTILETGGTSRTTNTSNSGSSTPNPILEEDPSNAGYPYVHADLSAATGGIDINELRNAVALQRIAEARSMFGSRYADFLRFYGVNPRDGRLDRPEYLGGGKQTISFSEVLATAEGTNTEVGDLFGHGIAGMRSRRYRKMFEEHGWMLSLLSVRPASIYQNGIPRRFSRTEPTEFWHRELEIMPWQSIPETELYGAGNADTVFGYTPRYDEYRELPNYVSGTLRGGTEEDWSLAREFSSAPSLNETFITCTPSDRIYSDTSMPELIITANNSIRARRLVSKTARLNNAIL
jgi:hypothetical protein